MFKYACILSWKWQNRPGLLIICLVFVLCPTCMLFRAVPWPEITKLPFHSWSRCIFLSHEKYETIFWFLGRGFLGSLGGNMRSLSSSCKFHRFLGISMPNYSLPTRIAIKICLLKRMPPLLFWGCCFVFFFPRTDHWVERIEISIQGQTHLAFPVNTNFRKSKEK